MRTGGTPILGNIHILYKTFWNMSPTWNLGTSCIGGWAWASWECDPQRRTCLFLSQSHVGWSKNRTAMDTQFHPLVTHHFPYWRVNYGGLNSWPPPFQTTPNHICWFGIPWYSHYIPITSKTSCNAALMALGFSNTQTFPSFLSYCNCLGGQPSWLMSPSLNGERDF
jgi:hypothetical protein